MTGEAAYLADRLRGRARVTRERGSRSRRRSEAQGGAEELRTKAIAEKLYISRKTVGTHIQRILNKLEVHSRAEAVALAYREGLVEDDAAHALSAADR